MKRLNKFLRLTRSERRLLLSAALLLGAIRLGLWLLPFQTLRRLLVRLTAADCKAARVSVGRVVWAVEVVSRFAPASNVSLGLWHRYCFAITVTKLTSASVLPEAERAVTSPRLGRKSGQDCQRWIKDPVALYPTPIGGKRQ